MISYGKKAGKLPVGFLELFSINLAIEKSVKRMSGYRTGKEWRRAPHVVLSVVNDD